MGTPSESSLQPRKIAFCVSAWSHSTTVLTWAWLRQYFLRVCLSQRVQYIATLHCLPFASGFQILSVIDKIVWSVPTTLSLVQRDVDKLFVVHTGKKENWKAAGPLCSDLDTSLAAWPHEVVALHGSLQSNITSFVERNSIDMVVLGEDFPRQGGLQIQSVSDWVRANITCPFMIIRPSAVRNERLRLSPGSNSLDSPSTQGHLSPESAPGRKVAIAYSSFPVGLALLEVAKQLVLLPQDEIFVVHCFPTENKVAKTTKTLIRAMTLGLPVPSALGGSTDRSGSPEEVSEDNFVDFGAKELSGYNANLNVVLRGDTRSSLVNFCETEGIELLVISTRAASRIRKTLSGGSVSGYLIDHAPCPCLVLPLKSSGVPSEAEEDDHGMPLSPNASIGPGGWGLPASSGSRVALGEEGEMKGKPLDPNVAAVAALQAQLAERDEIIRQLKEELARVRLEAAEHKDLESHDPMTAQATY